jgi:hypothetical protein
VGITSVLGIPSDRNRSGLGKKITDLVLDIWRLIPVWRNTSQAFKYTYPLIVCGAADQTQWYCAVKSYGMGIVEMKPSHILWIRHQPELTNCQFSTTPVPSSPPPKKDVWWCHIKILFKIAKWKQMCTYRGLLLFLLDFILCLTSLQSYSIFFKL